MSIEGEYLWFFHYRQQKCVWSWRPQSRFFLPQCRFWLNGLVMTNDIWVRRASRGSDMDRWSFWRYHEWGAYGYLIIAGSGTPEKTISSLPDQDINRQFDFPVSEEAKLLPNRYRARQCLNWYYQVAAPQNVLKPKLASRFSFGITIKKQEINDFIRILPDWYPARHPEAIYAPTTQPPIFLFLEYSNEIRMATLLYIDRHSKNRVHDLLWYRRASDCSERW